MKENVLTRQSNLVKERVSRIRAYAQQPNTLPYGMREPTTKEKEQQADERKLNQLFGGL